MGKPIILVFAEFSFPHYSHYIGCFYVVNSAESVELGLIITPLRSRFHAITTHAINVQFSQNNVEIKAMAVE